MSRSPQIFIVEDSVPSAELYSSYLETNGMASTVFHDGASALLQMEVCAPKVMLLDLELPDMNGLEILEQIGRRGLPISVIVITSNGSVDVAVEAMRLGASDFLEKPFTKSRLLVTLSNVLKQLDLISTVKTLKQGFDLSHCGRFIGSSLPMQVAYRIINSAASSKATIFITGESGTGKELCAEAIHEKSPRAHKPFVALNCAAIPKELFESEIFGHIKGAFSGASTDRKGAAEHADGGTLFLDEIGEMDMDLQSKLLRFIQTGAFTRVGETKPRESDIRFVCATNRDPLAEVAAGRFREDLYYRLNVVPIMLPPLRERDSDVVEIANHFLLLCAEEEGKQFKSFSPEVVQALLQHDWPGNVRELHNVVKNVVVLNQGTVVTPDMLPPGFQSPDVDLVIRKKVPRPLTPTEPLQEPSGIRPLWIVERESIESAIAQCNGNVPVAAAFLGVSASTIYRKRKVWEETTSPSPSTGKTS
jgi:two-component system, repressor protein LuxO